MNKSLVKYGISAVTALTVGACALVSYMKTLGVNKNEEEVPVEDISEEEIEPDDFCEDEA